MNPLNRTEFIACLRTLGACGEALAWIAQTPGEPADIWAACQRGDWMIWLLETMNYDARTLRRIACDVAEDALEIYEREYPDDRRPRDCIAVARRYADGEATRRELIAASNAAWAAVRAADDAAADDEDAASEAARAAAWAADSTSASDAAGPAAVAAAWAADSDVAGAAAWDIATARHADMVRARVSWADVERALEMFRAHGGGA